MYCNKCSNSIKDCVCLDINNRLRELSDGEYVIFKWCLNCDKHYDRCRCLEPLFGIRTGGKIKNAIL